MKVLVWKAYGEIDVYDVSTYEKFHAVLETIMETIEGWGCEEDIAKVRNHISKGPRSMTTLNRAFNYMWDVINPAYDNDSFEQLEIKELQ